MTNDTPYYPVITWPVTVSLNVDITINAVTTTHAVTNSGGYGWGTGSLLVASSGTVADAVRDALAAHAGASGEIAAYNTNASQGIPWLYRINFTTASISTAPTIVFATAADALSVGYDGGTTWTATSASGTTPTTSWRFTSTCNHVGYWAPYQLVVQDQRDSQGRAFASESLTGAVSVINWGSVTSRDLTFPVCQAAQLLLYRAADTAFAGALGRNVADTNNVLENLIVAARTNALLRVVSGTPTVGAYREARIVSPDRLNRVLADCQDEAGAGRLWSVTLPLRDLGGTAP